MRSVVHPCFPPAAKLGRGIRGNRSETGNATLDGWRFLLHRDDVQNQEIAAAVARFAERVATFSGEAPDVVMMPASVYARFRWGRPRIVRFTAPADPRARLRWDKK